jgi:hypothetical protein
MTAQFKAQPPSSVDWRSVPKHLKRSFRSFGYIVWQIVTPFESRPKEIAEFPEPDAGINVTDSHVKQCQWIFDQAEERRSHLEQKAQSTFSLMLFLVPLLASLFVLVIGKGTASRAFGFTLTLIIVSSIFLLLAFIAAVRAIAVKGGETLFLDAVIHESGQFRKYSEAYHARGLLYCASMNTAMNDHIAQFVKGAHILSAAAVLALLIAAIPSTMLFIVPAAPAQTQIVGPVSISSAELTRLSNDVTAMKGDVQKLSKAAVTAEDLRTLNDRISDLDAKLSQLQRAGAHSPGSKTSQPTAAAHPNR